LGKNILDFFVFILVLLIINSTLMLPSYFLTLFSNEFVCTDSRVHLTVSAYGRDEDTASHDGNFQFQNFFESFSRLHKENEEVVKETSLGYYIVYFPLLHSTQTLLSSDLQAPLSTIVIAGQQIKGIGKLSSLIYFL
jgi:hypothetical protein